MASGGNLYSWIARRVLPVILLVLLLAWIAQFASKIRRSVDKPQLLKPKLKLPSGKVKRVESRNDFLYYNAIHKTGSTTMGQLLKEQEKFYYQRTSKPWWRFHLVGQMEPVITKGYTLEEWRHQSLEQCIIQKWPQCQLQRGEIVDHQISYICGQDPACVEFDSPLALQKAKYNVEAFYPVIGILERMEETLEVMENVLPRIFVDGISDTYTGQVTNSGGHKSRIEVSSRAMEIMRNTLGNEYELYEFCQQRLSRQIKLVKQLRKAKRRTN